MDFFMAMKPPTATAQERSVKVIGRKPVFFDPPNVREARELLMGHLIRHKPDKPIEGAVELTVMWLFPKGKSHKHGEWRITKPDTDNLQKMLKDCIQTMKSMVVISLRRRDMVVHGRGSVTSTLRSIPSVNSVSSVELSCLRKRSTTSCR